MDNMENYINQQTQCPTNLISLKEWLDTPTGIHDQTVRSALTRHANRAGYFSEEDLQSYFEELFYADQI